MYQNIKFNSTLFLAFSMLSVLPITAHEYYLQKKFLRLLFYGICDKKFFLKTLESAIISVCSDAFWKGIERYSRLPDFNTFKFLLF